MINNNNAFSPEDWVTAVCKPKVLVKSCNKKWQTFFFLLGKLQWACSCLQQLAACTADADQEKGSPGQIGAGLKKWEIATSTGGSQRGENYGLTNLLCFLIIIIIISISISISISIIIIIIIIIIQRF